MSNPKKSRRKYGSEFKMRVAVSAIREEDTILSLCQKYELHPNQIKRWKKELLERGALIFDDRNQKNRQISESENIKLLQAKIGELTMHLEFLKKKLLD